MAAMHIVNDVAGFFYFYCCSGNFSRDHNTYPEWWLGITDTEEDGDFRLLDGSPLNISLFGAQFYTLRTDEDMAR